MSERSSMLESTDLGGGQRGVSDSPPSPRIAQEPTSRLDRINEWCSEWCSSILVKETRQALKSRQFVWTYFILLLSVGLWTVVGLTISNNGRALNYEAGRELLIGFWVILGFPLGLIIPFSAYRSLAREFEDGTIQLISITTMRPQQIVIGKFGSAMLQMLIYLSVLAPCILFTYLLRGISLDQIVLGLGICVGGSICLTILGLFLAGLVQSKALGIGVSVLYVLALGWIYFGWCVLSYEFTYYSGGIDWNDVDIRITVYCCSAFFGSTALLLLVAAASQISFTSDNRSTRIRIVMLVQQTLFLAVVVLFLPLAQSWQDEICLGMGFIIGHYWLMMGFLMIGERASMSRRVQRTLPRSMLSRSLFSLLMPGSGRGFLFAIANLWACSLLVLLVFYFDRYLINDEVITRYNVGVGRITGTTISMSSLWSMVVNALFVTWFLSITFLLMRRVFHKRIDDASNLTGPIVSLLVGTFLVVMLIVGSFVAHLNLADYSTRNDGSAWLIPNWYWSVVETSSGNVSMSSGMLILGALFFVQAIVVSLVALLIAARDLLEQPIETPERVAIEMKRRPIPLAQGESIQEIFGEITPDPSGD